MLKYIVLLSLFRSIATSSALRVSTKTEAEELKLATRSERDLLQSVPCPGGGPVAFFDLEIDLIPQGVVDAIQCTNSRKESLGNAINSLLLDYGIGIFGEGDDAAYLAHVCEMPDETTTARRNLLRRFGYVYNGSGTCRSCRADDFDRRQLQTIDDPNWFQNTYKPEMEKILADAISSNVAPNHQECLGSGPEVLVVITVVSSTEVVAECIIPPSNPPTPAPGDSITCPTGSDPYRISWPDLSIVNNTNNQVIDIGDGYTITMTITDVAPFQTSGYGQTGSEGQLYLRAGALISETTQLSGSDYFFPPNPDTYPSFYTTMQLKFNKEITGLYISVADLDSDGTNNDVVRVRMSNAANADVPISLKGSGYDGLKVFDNWAYNSLRNKWLANPGYDSSVYAQPASASSAVQTIAIDLSMFTFQERYETMKNDFRYRYIYPGIDFTICSEGVA